MRCLNCKTDNEYIAILLIIKVIFPQIIVSKSDYQEHIKQNTEYVFVRAMGNPNRNTTTHRRLLKIFLLYKGSKKLTSLYIMQNDTDVSSEIHSEFRFDNLTHSN